MLRIALRRILECLRNSINPQSGGGKRKLTALITSISIIISGWIIPEMPVEAANYVTGRLADNALYIPDLGFELNLVSLSGDYSTNGIYICSSNDSDFYFQVNIRGGYTKGLVSKVGNEYKITVYRELPVIKGTTTFYGWDDISWYNGGKSLSCYWGNLRYDNTITLNADRIYKNYVAHTHNNNGRVEPTCTTAGYTYCNAHGSDTSQNRKTIPALGHLTSSTVNPTCTEQGYSHCNRCNTDWNFKNPLGHNWQSVTYNATTGQYSDNNGEKSPFNCTTNAVYYCKCSRCNVGPTNTKGTYDTNNPYNEVMGTATGHLEDNGTPEPDATPYAVGIMVYRCSNDYCPIANRILRTETIPQKHFQIYYGNSRINKIYLGNTLIMNANAGTDTLVK